MPSVYENPLCTRYASQQMQAVFSDDSRYRIWRELWLALAEAQKQLGLPISEAQINELRANLTNIDYERVREIEKETRHDVMAHIHAFAQVCPEAKPIIHLGATSCYVTDNTDIILMRRALTHIKSLLVCAMDALARFAEKYKETPCLAYTHFQAAQPTTIGKRAALWLHELMLDFENLQFVLEGIKFPGCKGTTGTAASFLALFDGDVIKVRELERIIAEKMGFGDVYPVGAQTYSRKVDYFILSVLSAIAQSAYKFSGDIRLLCHMKEIDEPFEQDQVGSSAMAYKRNPMRSERIASLSRYVITTTLNPAFTAGTQWLERTLDDSANRRIVIPESFLAADAILTLYINIVNGLKAYPKMALRNLKDELPFMATENILMHAVKKGGDRQELHERIRQYSMEAGARIKNEGMDNNLTEKLLEDKAFCLNRSLLEEIMKPEGFIGLSADQVAAMVEAARVIINENKHLLGVKADITV